MVYSLLLKTIYTKNLFQAEAKLHNALTIVLYINPVKWDVCIEPLLGQILVTYSCENVY